MILRSTIRSPCSTAKVLTRWTVTTVPSEAPRTDLSQRSRALTLREGADYRCGKKYPPARPINERRRAATSWRNVGRLRASPRSLWHSSDRRKWPTLRPRHRLQPTKPEPHYRASRLHPLQATREFQSDRSCYEPRKFFENRS